MPFDLEEGELETWSVMLLVEILSPRASASFVIVIQGGLEGFGYISFDSKEEAENSVERLQGLSLGR